MNLKKEITATPYVFTYGSLMSGMWYHHYANGAEFIGKGATNNKYNLLANEFPFLIKDEPIVKVKGELYKVTKHILENQLDKLEGHPDGYKREITTITLDDGNQFNAWVYFIPREKIVFFSRVDKVVDVPSGDFREYATNTLRYGMGV